MWVKADLDPWAGHCCSLPVRSVFLFGEERKVWVYVRGWSHLLLWTLSAVDSSWESKEKKSLSRQNYIWSGLIWHTKKQSLGSDQIHLSWGKNSNYYPYGQTHIEQSDIFTTGYSSQTSRNFTYKTRSDTQNMSETFFRSMETFTTLQCLHSAMLRNGRPIKKTSQHPALDSRPPHLYGKQRFTPWPHPPSIKIFTMASHLSVELKRPGCFCSSSH